MTFLTPAQRRTLTDLVWSPDYADDPTPKRILGRWVDPRYIYPMKHYEVLEAEGLATIQRTGLTRGLFTGIFDVWVSATDKGKALVGDPKR